MINTFADFSTSKKKSLLLLSLFMALIAADIWFVRPYSIWAAAVLVEIPLAFLSLWIYLHSPRPAGERRSWLEAWTLSGAITLGGLALIFLLSRASGLFDFYPISAKKINFLLACRYPAGAVVQQFLLNLIIFPLCLNLLENKWKAVLLTSALFGFVHLPNLTLALCTFLLGIFWVLAYQRQAMLVPLVVSHLILATFLRMAVPDYAHFTFLVGEKCLPHVKKVLFVQKNHLWPELERFSSQTYYQEHGNGPEPYIKALYKDMLRREAEEDGVQYWTSQLATKRRRDVVFKFLTSAEYAMRMRDKV